MEHPSVGNHTVAAAGTSTMMKGGSNEIDEKLQNAIATLSSNVQHLKSLASLVTVTQPAAAAAAVVGTTTEKGDSSKGTNSSLPSNLENVHPNLQPLNQKEPSTPHSQKQAPPPPQQQASFQSFDEILVQLKQVEHAVSSLEEKMALLKTVVSDESAVLAQLEKTKVAAMSQQQTITIMKDEMKPLRQELPGSGSASNETDRTSDATAPTVSHGKKQSSGRQPSMTNKQKSQTSNTTTNTTTMPKRRPKKNDKDKIPWGQPLIALEPLSKQEFNSISRNIRGRIKNSVLNDALVDISTVAHTKYSILRRKHLKSKSKSSNTGSISAKDKKQARKSTKQYQETLALHRRLLVDDHGEFIFVSEQELRDSCAFFRLGESTARAILQILRSAKRLKQVYGQNSVVTYILLEG